MKPKLNDEQIRQAQQALGPDRRVELAGRDRDLAIALTPTSALWLFWTPTADNFEFAINFGRWPGIDAGHAFERALVLRHAFARRITLRVLEPGEDAEQARLKDLFARVTLTCVLERFVAWPTRFAGSARKSSNISVATSRYRRGSRCCSPTKTSGGCRGGAPRSTPGPCLGSGI